MYTLLKHLHSATRWLVLILLVASIIQSIAYLIKRRELKSMIIKFTLIVTHIQILIGAALYFISPKVIFMSESMQNKVNRFYLLEHALLMIIAVVLITIGYKKFKVNSNTSLAYKKVLVFYSLALLLILLAIPWPFLNLSGGWI